MKKLLRILFYGLLFLIAVLLYNTFTFPSKQVSVQPVTPTSLEEGFENRLKEAIKIPTISSQPAIDTAAYQTFNDFLDTQFALVDTTLEKTLINKFSRIYYWPGRNPMLKPI